MSYEHDEEDPEVVADLRLRAYTEKSRKGLSEAQFGAAVAAVAQAASSPQIVGQVPCRGRCGSLVDWHEESEEKFEMFNRILARTVDAPLDKTRIVFCDNCRKYGIKLQGDRNRSATDAMQKLIAELKAGAPGERERDILEKIKKLGHPDIEGLVQAIKARQETKPRARRNAL